MSGVETHKDLEIWQRGIALVEEIYEVTKSFPKEELYGLTYQIRRSAVFYPSNIAEGAGRSSQVDGSTHERMCTFTHLRGVSRVDER